MNLKKIHLMPKTKIGKISFWLSLSSVVVIIILNVIVNLTEKNNYCDVDGVYYSSPEGFGLYVRIALSLLAMASIFFSFVTSFISIIKYKDYAILLVIPLLLGLFGIMFVLGEFFFPH